MSLKRVAFFVLVFDLICRFVNIWYQLMLLLRMIIEPSMLDLRVLVFLSQLRSTFRGVEMARSSWGPSVRVLLCELCPCWWFLIARQLILGAHDTMGQNSLVNDETVAFQRYIVYGIELFNYVGHLPVVLENLPFCVIGPLYSFTLSSLLCTIRPPFW